MKDETMTTQDPTFDESLLSGYLDGELTQGEAQRVRVHLEDHPEARRLLEELRRMRDVTLSTRLAVPTDRQWDERARSPVSAFLRRSGWTLLAAWLAVTAGVAVWAWWSAPVEWWNKALSAALVAAPGLLFLSILLDRLKVRSTDRYRRVLK